MSLEQVFDDKAVLAELTLGIQSEDRPAQSLEPPRGRASRLQRCSGSAATEQDLCKTGMATSKVNWATTLDCVLTMVRVVAMAGV